MLSGEGGRQVLVQGALDLAQLGVHLMGRRVGFGDRTELRQPAGRVVDRRIGDVRDRLRGGAPSAPISAQLPDKKQRLSYQQAASLYQKQRLAGRDNE